MGYWENYQKHTQRIDEQFFHIYILIISLLIEDSAAPFISQLLNAV